MDGGSLIRKSARMFRNSEAVLFEDGRLTYWELYERACRLANALLKLGLRKGDRVCTLEDNSLESMEEICAVALAGLVRCPLYTFNSLEVNIYTLNLVGAKALIVQDRYWAVLAQHIGEVPTLEQVIVHGGGDGALDYDEVIGKAEPLDPMVRVDDDDVAIIRFSAGTTGFPKAIVHTNRGWMGQAFETASALAPVSEDDALLVIAPLTHAPGLLVWNFLARGVKQVVMPYFDPGLVLHLIERERITTTMLIPTMIQALVNEPDIRSRDLSSLTSIAYGAAPIAEQTLIEALDVWGNIMYQGYGQSEVAPISMLSPRHHVLDGTERERRWLRSAGRLTPNTSVKILSEEGVELPLGEVGEVAVRGPGAMKEIWNDPEATARRIGSDGYIRTGDLASMDEDGFIYMADRKEDMIISGGFNIWPAEVENALYSHPAVAEAVVVGIPHKKWGETPKALVVLREGFTTTEQELIEWCRERVGPVRKPTSVEFSAEPLPKSPIGKILRRIVREKYWVGIDRQVRGA